MGLGSRRPIKPYMNLSMGADSMWPYVPSYGGFPKLGVPSWGPYYKGILLFGFFSGSPTFVNPHIYKHDGAAFVSDLLALNSTKMVSPSNFGPSRMAESRSLNS